MLNKQKKLEKKIEDDKKIKEIKREIGFVAQHMKNVEFFFGNLEEYERFKGKKYKIIGANIEYNSFLEVVGERVYKGNYEIGIIEYKSFKNLYEICKKGVEAIVNCQRDPGSGIGGMVADYENSDGTLSGGLIYGLPVKRVSKSRTSAHRKRPELKKARHIKIGQQKGCQIPADGGF